MLKGQWAPIVNIAFNKDGDRLVSVSSLGTVMVWEAPRGERSANGK